MHIFVHEMKRLLKYLFPIIFAAAFWSGADMTAHSVSDEILQESVLKETACTTSLSSTETEFCVPRQVSFANTQQVQCSARRTTSIHRNNLEFAKSGKVINVGVAFLIQKISIITHSSLIQPAHRLLSLGKLII